MNQTEAKEYVGSLSNPGKMPGKGWGIPAELCPNGSKFAMNPNSVCHKKICYAKNGRNHMPNVKNAQYTRLAKWKVYSNKDIPMEEGHGVWHKAMSVLIGKDEAFRWFDTGDLQSTGMLFDIALVASMTPDTLHYLPTKEYEMVDMYTKFYSIPENLSIRLSTPIIDQMPSGKIQSMMTKVGSSLVYRDEWPDDAFICRAYENNGKCGTCRACWDRTVPLIAYPFHKGSFHVPIYMDKFKESKLER